MTDESWIDPVPKEEMERASLATVGRVIWRPLRAALTSRPVQVIALAFVTMMLWGYHGELELVGMAWDGWLGPGSDPEARAPIVAGVPWDRELISFWTGAFLLVIVPVLVIKLWFKQPLSRYGLGLPTGRWRFATWSFLALLVPCMGLFYIGAQDESMRAVYPLFRGISSAGTFALYELTYLPFFVAIEFVFRGLLLFGLAPHTDGDGTRPTRFPIVALAIQMLPYTAWHLGKPIPELWGTPVWGVAAAAMAFGCRSIWPVVLAHWLLNIWLDAACLGYF